MCLIREDREKKEFQCGGQTKPFEKTISFIPKFNLRGHILTNSNDYR